MDILHIKLKNYWTVSGRCRIMSGRDEGAPPLVTGTSSAATALLLMVRNQIAIAAPKYYTISFTNQLWLTYGNIWKLLALRRKSIVFYLVASLDKANALREIQIKNLHQCLHDTIFIKNLVWTYMLWDHNKILFLNSIVLAIVHHVYLDYFYLDLSNDNYNNIHWNAPYY